MTRRRSHHKCSFVSGVLVAVALMVLSGAIPATAQVASGSIVGTVRDSSGAVVVDAGVTVRNPETGIGRVVKSNSEGQYVVTLLQPGTYSVTVEREGFKKAVQPPFKLDVNQTARVDITLAVGSVSQAVEVRAAEPLVESQTSSLGQVVEESRVHALPLNGRNFVELSYLTPGVNSGPAGIVQQGSIPENERGSGAIQANGLTATNNNFLLNGFDNNEQQIGFEVIQPSIDAIQEFKVQTNNFGADIGRGGAVVNVVLKSGTNQFHGSAFEFLRNSAMDAKNYFDPADFPIPAFKQNQFGGTFGGPIIKNRTFFFGDYQGTRIRQSQTDLSIVPSMAERTGNFSDLLTGIIDPLSHADTGAIFDPKSTTTGLTRAAFSGNIIPANRLDPAALKIINLFPAPNRPNGQGFNFVYNPVLINNQDSFDIRVDHQLTPKDSFFGTFSFGNVSNLRPDPFPGLAGGGSFSGHVNNLARSAGLSDVHTFSSNKINEIKLGYTRYVVEAIPNFAGQNISGQMGIPGIFDPNNPQATGGLPFIGFTTVGGAGTNALGSTDWFPEFLRENNYQLIDSFTLVHNRHSFKFGADLKRRQHGFFQTQNSRGDFYFDPLMTENLTDGTGGSDVASFLLGYPSSAFRDGQKGTFGMSWWEFSSYLMDDFRVSSRLTLNLGLRYDLFTPMVEQHNRLANFDFATGQFVAPGMPGVSGSGNVVTDKNNFGPRFGFAWTPGSEKTVVRGGFGIFYDVQADQNDAELAYNPTGVFFSQSITNNPSNAVTPSTPRLSTGLPPPVYPTLADPSGRASAVLFNNRTSYIEEWNLNVERSLSNTAVLQVAYVGTHGVKLSDLSNLNQPVAPLDSNFSDSTGNFGRPYFNTVPNISAIRTMQNQAGSISHGLQIKFEKRFARDWSMLSAYTWQHTIGQVTEDEAPDAEPQNTYNRTAERGNNPPDFRHQFTSAWSYELPFGPGKKYLASQGASRWLVGGWQLNGIIAMYSGQAFTPLLSFDPTNTGSGGPRPDVIGDPYNFSNAASAGCPSNQQTIFCWYNPAAFAVPPNAPGQTFATVFGNASRGMLRGPAQYNVDFSVFKNFQIKEDQNLQLRGEAFNLFNTPEFGLPYNAVDVTGTAGSISSTVHSSRQLQIALKYTF
ncbi:MAG TPA: TonB-dependent receptor [Terriglobales bacterium]|nr:TonB-dependent receptor [Terriglobales bacterium]